MKPINFEEAPLENSRDVGSSPRQAASGAITFRFPIGGGFEIPLPSASADTYSAAQAAIGAYQSAGLSSGVYQAFQRGSYVDVLPTQVLDTGGSVKTLTPVMQQHVTVPSGTRTLAETLERWADNISQAAGVSIRLARAPIAPQRFTIQFGADDQPAGEALLAIMSKFSAAATYYRLLYDPNEHAYYLSIEAVPVSLGQPSPVAQGSSSLPPGNPSHSPYWTPIK